MLHRNAILASLLLVVAPPVVAEGWRQEVPRLETFRVEAGMAGRLAALGEDESLHVDAWPVAMGVRSAVTLTRHDVYAPDARLYRVDASGVSEVPRSRLLFFWGPAEDGGAAMVSLDPETGDLRGLSYGKGGEPIDLRSAGSFEELRVSPASLAAGEAPAPFTCADVSSPRALSRPRETAPAPDLTSLHTMTVAVDTDNELLLQKFADNVTNATNYVASLFAGMNVFYERDIKLRLVQGTTFYRVSSQADPYTPGGGLNEFTAYWSANQGAVSRGVAALLSGKSPLPNSASGVAWVDALCDKSFGYSYNQVFKIDYLAGDLGIVGHEIGHNLSSPHTHCYSPPADFCVNDEPGCWAGGVSCPAPDGNGDRGTLMSYCHLLAGCSASLVFHSRTISEYANPALAAAVGVCVFPASGATPNITPVGVSRSRGAAASSSTVATVTDADTPVGNLTVTVVSAPTGITVTSLTNAAGTISASVAAGCTVALGGNNVTLRVSDGSTTKDGTLVVTVTADATPPAVTAPSALVVEQTLCSGGPAATPGTSPALSAFVSGGSATDTCTASPTRLTAQVGGVDVGAGTVFPAGATTVTFRFQDGAGNVGSATAQVTVRRRGDVTASGVVDILDVVTLANAIVGNVAIGVSPYLGSLATGDADKSGVLNVTDLQLVQSFIVGNTPCLPTS